VDLVGVHAVLLLVPDFEVRVWGYVLGGSGFRVPDFEFRISDFGFRFSGLGFLVSVFGFQFRVSRSGSRA